METTRPPPQFSSEEAAAIIRDATEIAQKTQPRLGSDDIVAMAKELGVDESAVTQALAQRDAKKTWIERRRRALRGLSVHAGSYFFTVCGLFAINLMTSAGHWWFQWAAMGWGIGLASHAMGVLRRGGSEEYDERMRDGERHR